MLSLNTTPPNSSRHGSRGQRVAHKARNIAISIVVLLVLLVGGGVLYTWYMGKYGKVQLPEAPVQAQVAVTDPIMKPQKMAPDAVVGASVQMITSPLVPGSNAMITVKTNPDAECKISVVYDKTASTDSGLSPKVADEYGVVNWTWTVEPTAPLGSWPVVVSCANKKNSAVVKTSLKLEQKAPEATAGN